MALKTNLISYWKLEEASGTRVDAHGSNDLTDNNTVTSATGKSGNAADFEAGNSEYLNITDASQSGLDITGDLSINLWVNFESLTTGRMISKSDFGTADRAYSFLWVNTVTDYLRLYLYDGVTEYEPTVAWTPSTATWYMLTVVYDASAGTQDYYVNGSQQGTQQTGAVNSIRNSTANFNISAAQGDVNYFDGLIDEVAIWNKTLTTAEITEIYNAGTGLFYDDWDVVGGAVQVHSNLALLGVG